MEDLKNFDEEGALICGQWTIFKMILDDAWENPEHYPKKQYKC